MASLALELFHQAGHQLYHDCISSWSTPWTWPHTWVAPMEPHRQPMLRIPLPTSIMQAAWPTTPQVAALEFYNMSYFFWLEMLVIFLSIMVVAFPVGCLVYHFCVFPRQQPQPQDTATSYLVGYGLILPFWLLFPYTAVTCLGIHNKVYRFSMTVITPVISMFKTTAAMHGFSPPHTTTSMRQYALYYACPIMAKYDKTTQQYTPATWTSNAILLQTFFRGVVMTGAVASIYDMVPQIFPPMSVAKTTATSNSDNDTLLLLWNNLCYAALFQCYLTLFMIGLQLIQSLLTGFQPQSTMMNNPVFASTSPSNFWSRRWNLLIHDVLKRGVFLPVKQLTSSRAIPVMATFLASGLFHEWLQISLFPAWDHDDTAEGVCHLVGREGTYSPIHCYTPKYGASAAFFMWQAMLIAMEMALKPHVNQTFLAQIPAPCKTLATVVAGGCVAHWFVEPYVHSNFFLDAQAGLFLWKWKSTPSV